MIVRASSLLKGVRGEPASNLQAIEDTLRRLSQLADDFPRIAELDLNPLIGSGNAVTVVDARIRIEKA